MTLECGCCGKHFRGKQHWNFDKGFGRCLSCLMEWFVRDVGDRITILEAMKEQWPDQW